MRQRRIQTTGIAIGLGCLLLVNVKAAHAQFSGPNLPIPTQSGLGQLPSNVRDPQVQKLLLLRALQQRAGSGGGVKTGVPQFIPFGNNFMPNPMMQQTTPDAGAATDAPKAAGKSVAEKKADYQAAREERKRKSRERAEKRKAEAAARAKDKVVAGAPADPA